MENCPACGVSHKGGQTCKRCGMDFGPLIAVENKSLMHIREALKAYENRNCSGMLFHAGQAFSLKKTKIAARILAIAALINKDYDLALALWRYEQRRNPSP